MKNIKFMISFLKWGFYLFFMCLCVYFMFMYEKPEGPPKMTPIMQKWHDKKEGNATEFYDRLDNSNTTLTDT